MAAMVTQTCKCGCGVKFQARRADVARGWGKFASKSCKARKQERSTGQYAALIHGRDRPNREFADGSFQMSAADLNAGSYGDADWNTPFGDGKY